MDYSQLWQAILGTLEVTLSKANFNTWLKNTSIVEKTEDSLTISVPSTYHKEWINTKYQPEILKALKSISPEIKSVHYVIGQTRSGQSFIGSVKPTAPQELEIASFTHGLNQKNVFETFISGKNSELAYAAALAVAKTPGQQYNPLFIYGGVGLGKTHLLHAIGNLHLQNFPSHRVVAVSSEKFTNDFISSISNKKTEEFKKHYRTIDMLLIDDIQFIAGKEQTQEEFFHTFNELRDKGKQIVITSDRMPKDIPAIAQRLISRFEWGMVADIAVPDYETRVAILKTKLDKKGEILPPEVLGLLAENVQNNIRELEGALNRILMHQQMSGRTVTAEDAKNILGTLVQNKKRIVSGQRIAEIVSEFYNISTNDLVKQSRKKEFVKPRQIAMYLMRKELDSSFPSIGEFFGGRDHTTVMHAVEKIQKLCETDSFKHEVDLVMDKLYAT